MAYREPGVYTELINARPNTGFLPSLVPLIIGEGPKFFDHEGVAITRSLESDHDMLPSSKVTTINRVYTLDGGLEVNIEADGNYSLTGDNFLTWDSEAPDKPTEGSVYYVDYEARPEEIQYERTFVTSFDELTAYGNQLMKVESGGEEVAVNPVYMGAYLALEAGAPGVYILQVEPSDKETYEVIMATDINEALDKASFIEDAYYIVPMTGDSTAVGSVVTHCNTMSTVEERKERVAFVSVDLEDPVASNGIFSTIELEEAALKVSSLNNKRVRVPFVTKASKILSDGNLYDLTGEYVCAALAGLAAYLPVQRALTRQRIFNFVELMHVVKLSRLNKNNMAEAGFMVLEQPGGPGSAITIRHGVTTKMDNIADREHSVVVIADYVAKYLRSSLEGYIGVYNIDDFLKTKVSATITGCFNLLFRKNVLNGANLISILQDQDNPDTLLIDLSILPPYPCNYIDIKILVE